MDSDKEELARLKSEIRKDLEDRESRLSASICKGFLRLDHGEGEAQFRAIKALAKYVYVNYCVECKSQGEERAASGFERGLPVCDEHA